MSDSPTRSFARMAIRPPTRRPVHRPARKRGSTHDNDDPTATPGSGRPAIRRRRRRRATSYSKRSGWRHGVIYRARDRPRSRCRAQVPPARFAVGSPTARRLLDEAHHQPTSASRDSAGAPHRHAPGWPAVPRDEAHQGRHARRSACDRIADRAPSSRFSHGSVRPSRTPMLEGDPSRLETGERHDRRVRRSASYGLGTREGSHADRVDRADGSRRGADRDSPAARRGCRNAGRKCAGHASVHVSGAGRRRGR